MTPAKERYNALMAAGRYYEAAELLKHIQAGE